MCQPPELYEVVVLLSQLPAPDVLALPSLVYYAGQAQRSCGRAAFVLGRASDDAQTLATWLAGDAPVVLDAPLAPEHRDLVLLQHFGASVLLPRCDDLVLFSGAATCSPSRQPQSNSAAEPREHAGILLLHVGSISVPLQRTLLDAIRKLTTGAGRHHGLKLVAWAADEARFDTLIPELRHRISALPTIRIPPLHERPGDVGTLCQQTADSAAWDTTLRIQPDFVSALRAELDQATSHQAIRARVRSAGDLALSLGADLLTARHLRLSKLFPPGDPERLYTDIPALDAAHRQAKLQEMYDTAIELLQLLRVPADQVKTSLYLRTIQQAVNLPEAARYLNVNVHTLRNWMRRNGITAVGSRVQAE